MKKIFQIDSDILSVSITNKGAELNSIYHKQNKIEYLWQANPEIWSRHAPILFPFVGKLKNDNYLFNNQTFSLPQHGFARDMDFELVQQSSNSVELSLKDNETTFSNFPFHFDLRVLYTINKESLEIKYTVLNPSESTIFFSIGGHPGFNCPIDSNSKFEDYEIHFAEKENAGRYLIENGTLKVNSEPFLKNESSFRLDKNLFLKDALVFKNLKSKSLELKNTKNNHKIKFEWSNMPFFGIWTKPGFDQFICIEPWAGIADSEEHNGDITQKEGIIKLEAKSRFECSYKIILK